MAFKVGNAHFANTLLIPPSYVTYIHKYIYLIMLANMLTLSINQHKKNDSSKK